MLELKRLTIIKVWTNMERQHIFDSEVFNITIANISTEQIARCVECQTQFDIHIMANCVEVLKFHSGLSTLWTSLVSRIKVKSIVISVRAAGIFVVTLLYPGKFCVVQYAPCITLVLNINTLVLQDLWRGPLFCYDRIHAFSWATPLIKSWWP